MLAEVVGSNPTQSTFTTLVKYDIELDVFSVIVRQTLAIHGHDLKAMYANLTGHAVQQVQVLYSIAVRQQMNVQDQGKLSKYGQDGLLLLVFVPKGKIAELESEDHDGEPLRVSVYSSNYRKK